MELCIPTRNEPRLLHSSRIRPDYGRTAQLGVSVVSVRTAELVSATRALSITSTTPRTSRDTTPTHDSYFWVLARRVGYRRTPKWPHLCCGITDSVALG
ncbi:unnamed protein product [Pleuronectes platessa]|uniref:Uncharacterized protein n=1 Tax=Pleuronectes platessa TaxID=8262 RepID=A0A9N7U3P3_PLEPL|nr:unnamed protein product [Pleuronectes platessa]